MDGSLHNVRQSTHCRAVCSLQSGVFNAGHAGPCVLDAGPSARANYQLRVMRPECVLEFARAHDENMWRGLCTILEVPTTACSRNARDLSSLPLSLGGLGLRSATKTRVSAYWASWADTLPMVQSRHPQIADIMVCQLEGVTESPCMGAASSAAAEFDRPI